MKTDESTQTASLSFVPVENQTKLLYGTAHVVAMHGKMMLPQPVQWGGQPGSAQGAHPHFPIS